MTMEKESFELEISADTAVEQAASDAEPDSAQQPAPPEAERPAETAAVPAPEASQDSIMEDGLPLADTQAVVPEKAEEETVPPAAKRATRSVTRRRKAEQTADSLAAATQVEEEKKKSASRRRSTKKIEIAADKTEETAAAAALDNNTVAAAEDIALAADHAVAAEHPEIRVDSAALAAKKTTTRRTTRKKTAKANEDSSIEALPTPQTIPATLEVTDGLAEDAGQEEMPQAEATVAELPHYEEIYLVDFENVGCDGLDGIENLDGKKKVIIFYSSKSNRLSFEMHLMIGRSQAQFDYYGVAVGGKNALDHQLSTYLGYLIGTGVADKYMIVSKDNGYRFLTDFWASNRNMEVSCISYVGANTRRSKNTAALNVDLPEGSPASLVTTGSVSTRSRSRKRKPVENKQVENRNDAVLVAAVPVAVTSSVVPLPEDSLSSDAQKLFAEFNFVPDAEIEAMIAHGDKQDVYLQFVKQLGQERGLSLYYKAKKVLWH